MRFKEYKIVLAVIFAPLLILWGCQGNKPLSPSKVSNLSVSIPTAGLRPKASLLSTYDDQIYYSITGPLSSPVTGVTEQESSPGAGTDTFTISNVPIGPGEVLSIQLNDGADDSTSGEPLAIGAESLNLSGSNNTVDVQMGSVSRSCYQAAMSLANCDNYDDEEFNFESYGYDYGELEFNSSTSGGNYQLNYDSNINDVAFSNYGDEFEDDTCNNSYDLVDGWTGNTQTVAYLGNGNLVNYDYVPSSGQFYTAASFAKQAVGAGSTITVGDVYCVRLQGGTLGNHYAWLQIVDDGQNAASWFNNGNGSLGYPSFIYRVNTNVPYYRYEQTTADVDVSTGGAAGFCSLYYDGGY